MARPTTHGVFFMSYSLLPCRIPEEPDRPEPVRRSPRPLPLRTAPRPGGKGLRDIRSIGHPFPRAGCLLQLAQRVDEPGGEQEQPQALRLVFFQPLPQVN